MLNRLTSSPLFAAVTAPQPLSHQLSPASAGVAVQVTGARRPGDEQVLTTEALDFVGRLAQAFEPRRQEMLARRLERQTALDAGEFPDFLTETYQIRRGDWKVAPIPHDLRKRHVEITGPVERKMIINALNSG